MLTVYIFLVACPLIIFILSCLDKQINFNKFDDVGMTLGMMLLAFLIGGMIGLFLSCLLPTELTEQKSVVTIECLQDNNGVKGRMYLGSGYINSEMQYCFYYNYHGGYKICQLSPNNVLIKYSTQTPRCETYTVVKSKAWYNKFSQSCKEGNERFIIYVPKGSIKNNYSLDAK